MSVMECSIVFAIGAAVTALLIAYQEWKNANKWRETAVRQQDAAAKARMDAEEAKIWLADEKAKRKTIENRLKFAETTAREAAKRENAAKDALAGEQEKCEELRGMLAETRGLLDKEREESRQIYEDYTAERDAFARMKEENRALKQAADEVAAERRKIEEEKGRLIELTNFMNYRGTEDGQIEIPQRD